MVELLFSGKYISAKENMEKPNAEKIVLSNDAYALGDMIQELIVELRRISFRGKI